MRQQAGQQRGMNFTVRRRFAVDRHTQLAHDPAQLGIDILPFTHAQIVQIIDLALAAERVAGERFCCSCR